MRSARLLLLLMLLGALEASCQTHQATPPAPAVAASVLDCPMADPILDNLPVPTRASIEEPLMRARKKPYDEWTEYDRGVATTYLDSRFPQLSEDELLASVFSDTPSRPESQFRQWLELRGFSAPIVIFLLRNYTALSVEDVNLRVRGELARVMGTRRFNEWLEVATHFDTSADLTRYVVELLLAHRHPLLREGACRFGSWCHEHLLRDLAPEEAATVIREYADLGSDVVPLFVPVAAIFATDPAGFATEATGHDGRGLVAAHLLMLSGDLPRIEAFLSNRSIPEELRAYWAYRMAQDPPRESADLLERLRASHSAQSLLGRALSAPGAVGAPYVSCQQRMALLEAVPVG